MKYLFSLVIGLVTFVLCFTGAADIISWCVSGFDYMIVRLFFKLILWVLFFGVILRASIYAGLFLTGLMVSILEYFDR